MERSERQRWALVVVAVFLVLTAWGNAVAMFSLSLCAIAVLLITRRFPGSAVSVVTGVAVAVAVVFALRII